MKKSVAASLLSVLLLATAAVAQGDEQAMMEMWAKMSTPGAPHQALTGMVGTWDAEVKMWMNPNASPEVTAGTSVNTMALGGRWLEQHFKGVVMDQPFEGVGYTGYDNYKKQYIGWWIDNTSTASTTVSGTMDEAGKIMTCKGTMDDFMTGNPVELMQVLTFVDADHHKFEMWASGPDGQNHKNMEIMYSRKK